jgi:class 3 adenylate cyclase/tetratricopeptide (TPR) repeat protein
VPSCPTCGRELDGDFAFCPYCGATLTATAPPSREQRKVVTVLFCDVTGSTELGEQLDPEALRALLARYFEQMKAIVERHGGSVEKFIGDAVMAVFGVPAVHEDDALRAVRAAVEMRDAFPALGCQGRIGVTTGEVVTGTTERLATGDAVNLAARLEQAAAPGEILIGDATFRLTRDAIEVEDVPPLALKGKSEPVVAHRLLSVGGDQAYTRRLDTPMVGREAELDRLRDAFEQSVRDRSCQLFTVLGAAGIGKSRLLLEFLASREDALILRGRCLPYGEGITYWPVVEVAKQLPAAAFDGTGTQAIAGLLRDDDVATSREEIAYAFRKLLEAAASERAVVCVFDDIHWGEETFLDLVEHVADLSRDAPILLLCSARPELLDRRPGWAGGKVNATTVLLEPLRPDDADTLIESLGDVGATLADRIREAAEGNPLFVEQMVALVEESGNGDVVVPPTIQALLAARLDQLEPPERAVLERGSVEGRVFHRRAVEALAPDETGVVTRLTSLVRKELVRPDKPVFSGDDAFRFRHMLIRDAAYDALPKAVRADLHERFAEWLESHGHDLLELDELLGYHLEQAHAYRRALGASDEEETALAGRAGAYLASSGRKAYARGDAPAAVTLLGRAATLLPAESPERLKLVPSLADAMIEVGSWEAARALLSEARATARSVGDRAAAAEAAVGLVFVDLHSGPGASHAKARTELEGAIRVFEELDDKAGLSRAVGTAAQVHSWAGESGRALEEMERAARLARESGDRMQEQRSLFGMLIPLTYGPVPIDEVLEKLDAIEPRAEGMPRLHVSILRSRALVAAMQGRFDDARCFIADADKVSRELGLETTRAAGVLRAAGEIELLAGDAAAAERAFREGYETLERGQDWGHLASVAPLYALALLAQGRVDEAERPLELTGQWIIEDDSDAQIAFLRARARLAALRSDPAEAEALARRAVERAAAGDDLNAHADALMDLADAVELGGRSDEADAALHDALELYERKGNVVGAARVRQQLAR